MPPISDRLLSCTKWFVLLTALTLGACASQPQAPANAATADYSYKIGPGDTLNIVVWRNPELSMSVPVRPDGKISAPLIDDQILSYKQKMTVLDVMIAVGGITDFADGNRATILRTSENNAQYRVRLKDLVKNGDVSANVEMKPGDVVIIPQSWF